MAQRKTEEPHLHPASFILHPPHGFLILPPAMNQCPIRYATMQESPTICCSCCIDSQKSALH